jgi:release factor glutamine methyltransferase
MSLFTLGARLAADARRLSATIKIPKEEAMREIRRLAAHALKLTPAQLAIREREAPGRFDLSPYGIVFDRRLKGEPMIYIMGECGFRDHVFKVTPDVLIPRPETEELVEAALRAAASGGASSILDAGTGSGCVALSLALELPQAQVIGVDVSPGAVEVARENAERLQVDNVEFLVSDWYSAIKEQQFQLIVSNPPYIAELDGHLDALRFEPTGALVGGKDGLAALRAVIGGAPARLVAGGTLVVEHGYDQQAAVCELFTAAGFVSVEPVSDLSGNPRIVMGRIAASEQPAKPKRRKAPISA